MAWTARQPEFADCVYRKDGWEGVCEDCLPSRRVGPCSPSSLGMRWECTRRGCKCRGRPGKTMSRVSRDCKHRPGRRRGAVLQRIVGSCRGEGDGGNSGLPQEAHAADRFRRGPGAARRPALPAVRLARPAGAGLRHRPEGLPQQLSRSGGHGGPVLLPCRRRALAQPPRRLLHPGTSRTRRRRMAEETGRGRPAAVHRGLHARPVREHPDP